MKKKTIWDMHRLSAEEFRSAPHIPLTVVLDNVRSLNNIGSIFRTCDAFAVESLSLCGITATPPNRDIHKTALGAELSVAWRYWPTTAECIDSLHRDGWTVVAVEQVEGAVMLGGFVPQPDRKYALVFGNEVDGVDQRAVDMCDMAVEIPQAGTKHSLNVSVSGGVVLWHLFSTLMR